MLAEEGIIFLIRPPEMCTLHVTDLSYPAYLSYPLSRKENIAMKLYVGNLPHAVTDEELRQVFVPYGTVKSAMVIMDQITEKSRGFGFVEMSQMTEGLAAIQGLNGKPLQGRSLTVNEARPRENRNERSGGRDRRNDDRRNDDRGRQGSRRSW